MPRPILLISTPRSGSDWFADDCLLWKKPEYLREYFNPMCNFFNCAVLRQAFGSEVDWANIAVPWECQEHSAEYIYAITWARDPFRITKENYAAFKIGFFQRHFDCFALIGHRSHTFPGGSRPRSTEYWWERIFQSLEFNRHLLDEPIVRLVDHATSARRTAYQRMVAAQVILNYQTVRECLKYQIPILEYRRLVSLGTVDEVSDYLLGKIPASVMVDGLAERILTTKRVVNKSDAYLAWDVESFAAELVEMMPTEIRHYF